MFKKVITVLLCCQEIFCRLLNPALFFAPNIQFVICKKSEKSTGAVVSGDALYVFGGLTCDPPGVCPGEGGDKTGANSIEVRTFGSAE
jgi:hypothetical protein